MEHWNGKYTCHSPRGISAHAILAITCAADDGRLSSVPKACRTCQIINNDINTINIVMLLNFNIYLILN